MREGRRIMKIALIASNLLTTPPRGYGGAEQIIYDLGVELLKKGHKVVLCAPKDSRLEGGFVYETGIAPEKVHVDWVSLEKQAYEKYKDLLKEFDVIHSHTWFAFEYLAKQQNSSLNMCHTHHGHLNWRSKPPGVEKMNLFAISKFMATEYSKILKTHVKWVYNGIDIEKYPFKKNHGDRLIYVGRFAEYKQPHVAIEVAKKLNMPLDVVGGTFVESPEYVEQIKKACEANGFGFYPDAPHETKMRLLRKAKALLFPSRMGEPFGLVAVEAMACGTPVVATNDGAIVEVVPDGVVGFICNVYETSQGADGRLYLNIKRDPVEAMCEAVKRIDTIKSKSCRKLVEQNFTRTIMAQRYEKSYKEILEGGEW